MPIVWVQENIKMHMEKQVFNFGKKFKLTVFRIIFYFYLVTVDDVPCFIVFQKGLVVKSLVEHDKFDKVKRLIDKYDHLEDKKKPQFMFK